MHRLFLPLYRFLKDRKWLLYTILVLTTAIFAWFGTHLRLEEDISKLLPRSSTESELAFSDIALKDKVILQITAAEGLETLDVQTLGAYMDEFSEALLDRDPDGKYIKGILSMLDPYVALGAMDYGLSHFPSFIDSSFYADFEALNTPEAISKQMKENYEMLRDDITGDAIKVVSIDPLNYRSALLARLMPEEEASEGGYTIEEGHFFCPDRSVAMAFVTPGFTEMESGKATKFYRMLEKTRAEFEQEHPDAQVLAHGNPLGSVANAGTIKRDMLLTVGISMILIIIIMLLCFRDWKFILKMIAPVAYGALFALACMYWLKGFMSLMSLGISSIILGVAISYCLHALIHHHFAGDVERVLKEESTPIVLGCVTTVGAFLALLFTESDLLRDFGLFSAFALVGSTLATLVFLPHFLRDGDGKVKEFKLIDRINNFPWDRNKWIIGAMALILVAGVAMSHRVKFDSDLRNLDFDEAFIANSQKLYEEKNRQGFTSYYFAAYDNDLDKALEYNDKLFVRLDSLKREGLVKGYSNLASLLFQPEEGQMERIRLWKEFWNPQRVAELKANLYSAGRRNNIAPATFEPFIALIEGDYKPGNLFEADVLPEELLSNFIEHESSGRYMVFTDVSFDPEDTDKVTDALVSGEQTIILEPFYYCRDMVEIVHDDFNTTLLISSIFVLLVLLLAFRRFPVALTAFLPMFLSWYVMQGLMALFGLEFNLINIVISTFVFGIGVDYSIFVMQGLLQEARTGEREMLSWHKTAIFFSALVLIIVVASLAFARHPAIRSIGIISVIGMTSTILLTYCLEPLVFRLLMKIPSFAEKTRRNCAE
ncbi:MAG: MMPL family transporter [Bacteroidales bacterium]|nr:MMPL family transporter [Bacteroidales bacterium]